MERTEAELLSLAGRVAEGDENDWPSLTRSADRPEDRAVVGCLQEIEQIAVFHRSLMREAASVGPEERRWGALVLRECLGQGSFGVVYRAWDPSLDREVALKLYRTDREHAGDRSLDPRREFLREGRAMARVRHANVVIVHGAEEHDGQVGIWMEYVRGESLAEQLKSRGILGAHEAAVIGLDLTRALAAVHRCGLVHQDIKPQNILREQGGRIVLMDFGLGREIGEAGIRGFASGTPMYMPPEAVLRGKISPQSDIYSLGVTLYHLVTGEFPVRVDSMDELIQAHREGRKRLLRDVRPDLPDAFIDVVERAIEADPARRFPTMGEMERALAAVVGAPAPLGEKALARRRRPRIWWGSAAALGAAAVILTFVPRLLKPKAAPVIPIPGASTEIDTPGSPAPPPQTATSAHTVEAVVCAVRDGAYTALQGGAKLRPSESLSLQVRASKPTWLYVIGCDAQGEAFLLFPPGLGWDLSNPIPANTRLMLPGRQGGRRVAWKVTSRGTEERLLLVAMPERDLRLEAELAALPVPTAAGAGAPGWSSRVLTRGAVSRLRGIGGLEEVPEPPSEAVGGTPLDDLLRRAQPLGSGVDTVAGTWIRKVEFRNP